MKHTKIYFSCQSLKVCQTTLATILTNIQQSHFYPRTGYGDSISYYRREGGSTSQEGFQGNGAAPDFYLAQSRILLKDTREQGNEEALYIAYSLINIYLVAFMLVDNRYLYTLVKPTELPQENLFHPQENLMNWHKGIQVLGGAIKQSKCY